MKRDVVKEYRFAEERGAGWGHLIYTLLSEAFQDVPAFSATV